jgi:hypothetical protein
MILYFDIYYSIVYIKSNYLRIIHCVRKRKDRKKVNFMPQTRQMDTKLCTNQKRMNLKEIVQFDEDRAPQNIIKAKAKRNNVI